jgi:hypothetical protein
MSNNQCPHGNLRCRNGSPCTPCAGNGILRDGETLRVKMNLMDSASRTAMTDAEVRAQALADHQEWVRAGRPKVYSDPVADALSKGLQPTTVSDNGYAQCVADLDWRTRKKPEPSSLITSQRTAHHQDGDLRRSGENGYAAYVDGLDYRTRNR